MAEIALTRGYVAIVDEADLELVGSHKWSAHSSGYAVRMESGRMVYMHRLIMNATGAVYVDHINGDVRDNRRSNLRLCSGNQSAMNRGKVKRSTSSRYKGVWYQSKTMRWHAHIRIPVPGKGRGRRKFLGSFGSEIEAARAYNEAALMYHGTFARLNEIQEDVCR